MPITQSLTENEFDTLFAKFYSLSYMLKYKHLYQFYKDRLKYFDKKDLLVKLNYELNRLLFIATWDIHTKELRKNLYYNNCLRNKQLLKKHKIIKLQSITINLNNKISLEQKRDVFTAINCKTGKITYSNPIRIIL